MGTQVICCPCCSQQLRVPSDKGVLKVVCKACGDRFDWKKGSINPMRLKDLHPREYEHPLDTIALDEAQKLKGWDLLLRQLNKHALERYFKIQHTGSSIKVTPRNCPDVYRLLRQACDVLNYPDVPDLYIERASGINGFTVGSERPIIVLQSESVDLLTSEELSCMIGHEVGHIKSCHCVYHLGADVLLCGSSIIAELTLGLGALVTKPLQLALLKWRRMSELTADRAGLLAVQDKTAYIRLLAKMSGVPVKYYDSIDCEDFIQQAKEFEGLNSNKLDMLTKWGLDLNQTHPWTVERAAELLRWIEGGEYDQVVSRATRIKIKPTR